MNKMQNFIFDEFITTAHTHLFEIIISWFFSGGIGILECLVTDVTPDRLLIGQLHDDDIWLQLPEFILVLLCYLNLSIPLRIKEQ